MNAKTATYIGSTPNNRAEQRIYRLDPPIQAGEWQSSDFTEAEYVVVSATRIAPPSNHEETYIFASDETGHITCWGELDGSFQGGLDHEQALNNAGYEIVS